MKIVYTKENIASNNIAKQIRNLNGDIILTEFKGSVLEAPTNLDVKSKILHDTIIVLSTHKSKNPSPMLTAHTPGNWTSADLGGEKNTLNYCAATLMKKIIRKIKYWNDKLELDWPVFLEADHHGPTGKNAMVFVEVGSSEKEWNNEKACEIIARAVIDVMEDERVEKNNKPGKVALCVGGGHYSKFTKIDLNGDDYIVGHILPKYKIDEIDEGMFIQGIEKNVEGIASVVLIDKKGCTREQKEKIKNFCKRNRIEHLEMKIKS